MEKSYLPQSLLKGSNYLILTLFHAFHNMIKFHDNKLGLSTPVTHTKIVLLFNCSTAACFSIIVILKMLFFFFFTAEMLLFFSSIALKEFWFKI